LWRDPIVHNYARGIAICWATLFGNIPGISIRVERKFFLHDTDHKFKNIGQEIHNGYNERSKEITERLRAE
jgi:hypothetical protein